MNKESLYHIPDNEKAEIFRQASSITRLPAHAVEKDWWVVQTLGMIFGLPEAEHLVFKGGTSLSKGWNLIERFSEDIDLAIDRKYFGFDGALTRNQIDKLRKTAGTFVDDQFIALLQAKWRERSFDKVVLEIEPGERSDRDRTILLHYPNVIASPGYLPPTIKIEFSCRSLMEPSSLRNFGATVDEAFPTASFVETPITVPVVNPERTMLEKIFLLHEEFQKPTERIRTGDRLSRHLYDAAKLSTSEFAAKALASPHLYQTIVVHRATFNTLSGVDYSRHAPATIQIIPPDAVLADWKKDYATMMEEMIYEENKPSFEDLMVTLNNLNKRINALDWKLD
ncbi:MAG TPA: nucleotidyl transferase AbiEii/AbiGii toxin family protein [Puia sp.]|nr:nucleotidyl transferase AbiEii/AbiGii toxin family protein [Puia sp.]